MRLTVIPILLLAFQGVVFGQFGPQPCSLGIGNSPTLRGLRLGMSPSEAQTALSVPIKLTTKKSTAVYLYDKPNGEYDTQGGFVDVGEEEGYADLSVGERNENTKGLERVRTLFFDQKLYQISVGYDSKSYPYKTVRLFTADVSTLLNLPAASWDYFSDSAHMKCSGFRIMAIVMAYPDPLQGNKSTQKRRMTSITLTNYLDEDRLKQRAANVLREQDQEKKRRDAERRFKP